MRCRTRDSVPGRLTPSVRSRSGAGYKPSFQNYLTSVRVSKRTTDADTDTRAPSLLTNIASYRLDVSWLRDLFYFYVPEVKCLIILKILSLSSCNLVRLPGRFHTPKHVDVSRVPGLRLRPGCFRFDTDIPCHVFIKGDYKKIKVGYYFEVTRCLLSLPTPKGV